MNPVVMAAKLMAAAAHEVVTEYRRLDAPPPPPPEPARQEMSCISASTQVAGQPVTRTATPRPPRIGFGAPGKDGR